MESLATAVPPRSEVSSQHTWDATSVFADDAAWEAEIERLQERVRQVSGYQGTLGQSPSRLQAWMEEREALLRAMGHVYVYASMFSSVDTGDSEAQAKSDRAMGVMGMVLGAIAFAEPEIIAIGGEALECWLGDNDDLAVYRHYFQDLLRRQAHVRSAEVEEVLGLVMDPFYTVGNTAEILTNAEIPFRPVTTPDGQALPVAQGTIDSLLMSGERDVREQAWKSYADGYLAVKNTLANNLTAAVKQNVFLARVRRYDSALEAALNADNIPTAVFHNLIDTYRKHIPIWHRYWRVRRRALGYDELQPWDIKAPLTREKPEISYEQAVEWVCEGMAPLGEEYVGVMRAGALDERWIDIYPNRGKRQGAFSSGWPGTKPFILMNFTYDLESMSTIAHEMGHSMHSYLAWQHQPDTYGNYSMFVAEVASNFNQAMVRAHLLATQDDPTLRLALLEEAFSNFHRYFFIMPSLARFELEMYERVERGEGITADGLNALLADLYQEGYGDEIRMDRDRVGITWAQFGHLYANFYVFQYATGISGAHALAERILRGDEGAAEAYLDFLKAGSSQYALDVLRQAGVDLSTPEPVETAFGVLERMVQQLEELVGR